VHGFICFYTVIPYLPVIRLFDLDIFVHLSVSGRTYRVDEFSKVSDFRYPSQSVLNTGTVLTFFHFAVTMVYDIKKFGFCINSLLKTE
jgi:hypothetical protein